MTVDQSASYDSWHELVDTVSAIVLRETTASSSKHPWIKTSRHDRNSHPDDHFDHHEVGDIVAAFRDQQYQVGGWASYQKRTRKVALDALQVKRTLMKAYRTEMKELYPGFDEAETESHDELFLDCEGE